MSIELKALMFDTQSIQRYIFSGNRLRTNIGASYIVAKIFEEDLIEVLKKKFPNGVLQFTNKKKFSKDGLSLTNGPLYNEVEQLIKK